MDPQDLQIRFTYHPPRNDGEKVKYETIRSYAHDFAQFVNVHCPDSREKNLTITALEECVMWANASIARHPS